MIQSGRIKAWRDKMDRDAGETLFRDARAEFENGATATPQTSLRVAQALSVLILLTPVAMILTGLLLASVDSPNLIPIPLRATLVACGIYVLPRRAHWSRWISGITCSPPATLRSVTATCYATATPKS